jgi:transposase
LGRSRGGFSTKIHLTCDALGNALRFILTSGERSDITQAANLVENFAAEFVLADKGYDANDFIRQIEAQNSSVVIPSKANRKVQRTIDRHLYKERHLIENQIGKLKHFRRVFSRFDKVSKELFKFCLLCQHNHLA